MGCPGRLGVLVPHDDADDLHREQHHGRHHGWALVDHHALDDLGLDDLGHLGPKSLLENSGGIWLSRFEVLAAWRARRRVMTMIMAQ